MAFGTRILHRTFIRLFAIQLLFLPSSSAQRQDQAPEKAPATVLKATTRLVLVDVITDDGHGKPVTDLKLEDFVIVEDGKEQKVRSMVLQQPGSAPKTNRASLPPNT